VPEKLSEKRDLMKNIEKKELTKESEKISRN